MCSIIMFSLDVFYKTQKQKEYILHVGFYCTKQMPNDNFQFDLLIIFPKEDFYF